MSTVVFCIAVLVGIIAWGFLLAGAITFNDPDDPTNRGFGLVLFFIDIFVSLGLLTMLFVIARNWKRKPEARHLFFTGIIFLIVAVGLAAVYKVSM